MNNFNTGLVVFIVVEQGANYGFISGEDYAEVIVELHCVNAAADHGFGSIVAAESVDCKFHGYRVVLSSVRANARKARHCRACNIIVYF